MIYTIHDKTGAVLNTIVASREFVEEYCRDSGFSFEKVEETVAVPTPELEQTMTVWEELDAAYQEGVNSAYDGERTSAQS